MKTNLATQILKLRKKNKTYNEIVSILNCSKSLVCYYLGKNQRKKTTLRTIKLRKLNPLIRKVEHFCMNCKQNTTKQLKYDDINAIIRWKYWQFMAKSRKKRKYSTPTFSVKELKAKIGNKPKCYLTGKSIDLFKSRSYHLDHIHPRSRGGSNTLDNLGICTKAANQAKSDLTFDEFIQLCKDVLNHNGYRVVKK